MENNKFSVGSIALGFDGMVGVIGEIKEGVYLVIHDVNEDTKTVNASTYNEKDILQVTEDQLLLLNQKINKLKIDGEFEEAIKEIEFLDFAKKILNIT